MGSVWEQSATVQIWVMLVMPVCVGLHLGCRNGELDDVDGIVRAGVVAVEEVEELDERADPPAVADREGAGDAEVGLEVWCSAELIEAGVGAVDPDSGGVVGVGDGDGASAFELRDGAELEAAAEMDGAGEHEAMADIFAGGAVVAGAEGIELPGLRASSEGCRRHRRNRRVRRAGSPRSALWRAYSSRPG